MTHPICDSKNPSLIRAASCSLCRGIGYFWARPKHTGLESWAGPFAFKCPCPIGKLSNKRYREWTKELNAHYIPEWKENETISQKMD